MKVNNNTNSDPSFKSQARQGDVLILKVDKIKESQKVNPKTTITAALGEVTGHHHTLTEVEDAVGYGSDERLSEFAEIGQETEITHAVD